MKTTGRITLCAIAISLCCAACGPTFDPASLVESTRVVGARVEVDGAPDRATPQPGESSTVTWLVTAPGAVPPLSWAFALCRPEIADGMPSLSCGASPLGLFQGTAVPPRIAFTVPSADALGDVDRLQLFGRVCDTSAATFDADSGAPGCADGGGGTTAAVTILLQRGAEPNHNPVVERAFTIDGQPWPTTDDPCATTVAAATDKHVITLTTEGADREPFTAMIGDPPIPTTERESLQLSELATGGKFDSPFDFVEAADPALEPAVTMKWDAPKTMPAAALPITFTFVLRDGRGGTAWTTRVLCVTP